LFQHSWKQFLYTKHQNINRSSLKDKSASAGTLTKKPKLDLGKHPYPSIRFALEDDESYKRTKTLLNAEILNTHPDIKKAEELMGRTFTKRRVWLLDKQLTVMEVCEEYPFKYSKLSIVLYC